MPTPENFLIRLKEHFKFQPNIEGAKRSDEFIQITNDELYSFENTIQEKVLKYKDDDDYLVQNLVDEILPILSFEERKMLKKCAFGKLHNSKMNAFCAKSKDGNDNYCILINAGLLTLLNKYGKLILAQKYQDSIKYCNRGDYKQLNQEDYSFFLEELVSNYSKYNAPVGVMLKLQEKYQPLHSTNLHFQELFVLCHELGHLFNKDLDESRNLINLVQDEADIVSENRYHDIEYSADIYAFDIFCRVAKNTYNLEKKDIVHYVAILFDIMASINPQEGQKHPSAINRMLYILESYWSPEIAMEYIKTYTEEITVEIFFEML